MLLRIIIVLLLNFLALALGGLFTSTGVKSDWYTELIKAPWTPPGWVFGFAWTIIMICFAFYMAYLWDVLQDKKTIILLYSLQWVLNVSWNPIFFKYHQVNFAFFVISALMLLIGFMLFNYANVLKLKSLFISPYFLWLIIATSLNAFICLKN